MKLQQLQQCADRPDKPCPQKIFCCKCSKKLCYIVNGMPGRRVLEGHYVGPAGLVCVECWSA